MHQPLPDSDLVVATPERVSFDYQVAGLGTRAIAQLLDLLIVGGILTAVYLVALAAELASADTIAALIAVIGSFVVIFGYFWVSESLWSGQTIGKKVFRLRVVGDRGEPLTFMQAGIRNVVRIVDFLPYAYGIGLVVLFANGRGKRLGDLAAGTVVVKDSDRVGLWQLPGGKAAAPVSTGPGLAPPLFLPPAPVYAPVSAAELSLRRLDPELRRFVTSYARRRPQLSLQVRVQLAHQVQPSLRAAVPDVFAEEGPLAALDHLADLERQ
ncbi:MAG TPA: RDD family protein [Candidatus Dormibacteraeota bacterium]|nr:RDD family protein [Candidatus Dormibacteraeota bacterium]